MATLPQGQLAEEIPVRPGRPRDDGKRPWRRRAYKALVGALGVAIGWIARGLPIGAAVEVGRTGGLLAWVFSRSNRRLAEESLRVAFPEQSEAWRRNVAKESFARVGGAAMEWICFPEGRLALERHVAIEGLENIDAALGRGKGVLWITGHVGCWELMGARIAAAGYHCSVIATRVRYAAINRYTKVKRAERQVETIERESPSAGRELLRLLRGNGNLGILMDHDMHIPSIQVEFFGRKAWTALGAAELAIKLGCAAVPAFIVPQPDGGHLVKIGAPILPPGGVPKSEQLAAVRDLTQRYTRAIEEHIRAYPYDWAWMHRRWNP